MTLARIKTGWAAYGDGWAVHGATEADAIERFHAAEARHAEIDARPFPWEMLPAGARDISDA